MQTLLEILRGEMAPGLRVSTALAPALLLLGVRPLWRALERSALPPRAVATLAVLLGVASGVAAAAGRFALAGWLLVLSGVLDAFHRRLGRLRGAATPWRAAIVSTLDRWTDAAVLGGLAWYYRGSWVLVPALLALVGTGVAPYVRARGEGLGVAVEAAFVPRTARVVALGAAMALSPVVEALAFPRDAHPVHWLAALALCGVAVTCNSTGVVRLVAVVRALKARAGLAREPARPVVRRMGLSLAASVAATGIDLALALALLWAGLGPFLSTAGGCLAGAVVNFGLNRAVTFRSEAAPLPQARRYAGVSLASLALNAGGVSVVLSHPAVAYPVAWWLVRAAVFVAWNYPLHAEYVFGDRLGGGHA